LLLLLLLPLLISTLQMAAMDVLMKHEFLRIKLGEGCGLERKRTAALLGQLLDSAVVGQVGFTITLYRQKGLPRPDNLTTPAAAAKAA
jgi:RNA-binding protein YhbY